MALPITFGTTGRVAGLLDPAILDRFLSLDQKGKIAAEYVWIGGTGSDLRSKTKTLSKAPKGLDDLPIWNYDGSSCGQAPGVVELLHFLCAKDPSSCCTCSPVALVHTSNIIWLGVRLHSRLLQRWRLACGFPALPGPLGVLLVGDRKHSGLDLIQPCSA